MTERLSTIGDHGFVRVSDLTPSEKPLGYIWRVGDVFTNGTYRWQVDSVEGDKAVLRSCSTSWATTRPLTFKKWREGGRWHLEVNE